MLFVRNELEWLQAHARKEVNGFFCRKTNVQIRIVAVLHYVDGRPFTPIDPERSVAHLVCDGCPGEHPLPEPGSKLFADALVDNDDRIPIPIG